MNNSPASHNVIAPSNTSIHAASSDRLPPSRTRRSLSPHKVIDYKLAVTPQIPEASVEYETKFDNPLAGMSQAEAKRYLSQRPLVLNKFMRTLIKSLRRSEGLSMARIAYELDLPIEVVMKEMPHL